MAYGATPPVIVAVTPTSRVCRLGQMALKLQAEIALGHIIPDDGVWATIIPPGAAYATRPNPVTNLITVKLTQEPSTRTWSAIYPSFSKAGDWRVTLLRQGGRIPVAARR